MDLSASLPDVKANLTAELAKVMAGAYQTNDTPGYNNCVDEKAWSNAHRNFLGPPCTKGNATATPAAGVATAEV